MTPTQVYSVLSGVPVKSTDQAALPDDMARAVTRGYQPVIAWLSLYWTGDPQPQPSTYTAYEKEVLRFFVWMVVTLGKTSCHSVTPADLRRYAEFLSNPLPHELWVSHSRSRPNGNLGRREYLPFCGPLAQNSIRFAVRVVLQMLKEMDACTYPAYRALGPVGSVAKGREAAPYGIPISAAFCRELSTLAHKLPDTTIFERRQKIRLCFVIELFHSTGIQVTEALKAKLGDMLPPSHRLNRTSHWLLCIAPGTARERYVRVSGRLLHEHLRYTHSLNEQGLSEHPDLPLIRRTRRKNINTPISRQQLHGILRPLLLKASMTGPSKSAVDQDQASRYWSRYSCALLELNRSADVANIVKKTPHLSRLTLANLL